MTVASPDCKNHFYLIPLLPTVQLYYYRKEDTEAERVLVFKSLRPRIGRVTNGIETGWHPARARKGRGQVATRSRQQTALEMQARIVSVV